MSKRIIYLLLAVSLGLNVGVIATTLVHRTAGPATGPRPGPGGIGGPRPGQQPDPARIVEEHVRGMTRHLDLDAEQQQAIRAIMEHHTPELIRLQRGANEAGRLLTEAYAAPHFNTEGFLRLTAEASAARARLDSLSGQMLASEAAVLTPQQRLQFSAVAPTIHSQPQRPRENRPPPR
jgi:Spy/CpxP family protein refolding chaperone